MSSGLSLSRPLKLVRRGLSAAQVALILPILLTVSFGVIEYGWTFLKASQIAHAVREGARVGARDNADVAAVRAKISLCLTNAGLNPNLATITVPNNLTTLASGQTFTIQVLVPYAAFGLNMPLLPKPASLKSSYTMMREGP
jgi:Flp pilus assembly protein TadG